MSGNGSGTSNKATYVSSDTKTYIKQAEKQKEKAKKLETKYKNKITKSETKYKNKVTKHENSAKKYELYVSESAKFDKKMQEIVSEQSKGKKKTNAILKENSIKADMARYKASNTSVGKRFVYELLYGSTGSYVARREYINRRIKESLNK